MKICFNTEPGKFRKPKTKNQNQNIQPYALLKYETKALAHVF